MRTQKSIMRMLGMSAAAALLPAGMMVLSPGNAPASVAADVTNATIQCNTVIGKSSFNPPATFGCSGNEAITVKATLLDCSTNAAGVQIAAGSVKGILNLGSCDCFSFDTASPYLAGSSLVTKWKIAKTSTKITPTSSTLNVTGSNFKEVIFVPPAPFTGVYDQLINISGGVSVTGAFQGLDGGASSAMAVATQQTNTLAGAGCEPSVGLKSFSFSIGNMTLQ